MIKNRQSGWPVTLGVIITLLGLLVGCGSDAEPPRQADPTTSSDTAGFDSLTITLTGKDQTSALELLREAHDVEIKSTALGAFVTRVDQAEKSSRYFWMYSVNDSFPNTACDRYVTSDGDRVVWHFRRIGL